MLPRYALPHESEPKPDNRFVAEGYPLKQLRARPVTFVAIGGYSCEPTMLDFDVLEIHCGPPAPLPAVPTPADLLNGALGLDLPHGEF